MATAWVSQYLKEREWRERERTTSVRSVLKRGGWISSREQLEGSVVLQLYRIVL